MERRCEVESTSAGSRSTSAPLPVHGRPLTACYSSMAVLVGVSELCALWPGAGSQVMSTLQVCRNRERAGFLGSLRLAVQVPPFS